MIYRGMTYTPLMLSLVANRTLSMLSIWTQKRLVCHMLSLLEMGNKKNGDLLLVVATLEAISS